MIAAYRESDPVMGKTRMESLIIEPTHAVPVCLTEAATLGQTLKKRAADILAFFDHPNTSNGPTEAINGRPERLRDSTLGFLNLAHHAARAFLGTGGFRPALHPRL